MLKVVTMTIVESIWKAFMSRAPRVRGLTKKYYFAHPFLDAWFVWFPLNNITFEGGAAGEIYNVASRINERDPKSWGKEWTAEGERVEALANTLLQKGHTISARGAFLRAFTYYRTGHVVYMPGDPELVQSFEALQRCFKHFADLADILIEEIQIPYTKTSNYPDKTMRGYFFSQSSGKKPTVIFLNGAESMSEDAYFWTAVAGVQRGYNIFVADAPGDFVTRIYDPDFILDDRCDAALHSMVDYALAHPGVDPEKLAVYGISMGGYKAGRLAQIESRVKAVIANAPMLNAGKVLHAMKKVPTLSEGARQYAVRFCWQYGIEGGDVQENTNRLVDEMWNTFEVDPTKISCPFLSLYGENELGAEAVRQVETFHSLLKSEIKTIRKTTVKEGAEAHCQLNNFPLQHQITYDWLDDVIGKKG
jgi:hypothetical protein